MALKKLIVGGEKRRDRERKRERKEGGGGGDGNEGGREEVGVYFLDLTLQNSLTR